MSAVAEESVPELPAYRRNPDLYVRRPGGSGVAADGPRRLPVPAKSGWRRLKRPLGFGIVLAGAYALAGVCVCLGLSDKIATAERRLPGVEAAIARVTSDRQRVSERLQGVSSAESLVALMEDVELDRIAGVYLGDDWSTPRRAFLAGVREAHDLQKAQEQARKAAEALREKTIRDLQNRKRGLRNRLKAPKTASSEGAVAAELAEIERQLQACRDDAAKARPPTKVEDEIARLASLCRQRTVGPLQRAMDEKLGDLRAEAAEPARLRRLMAWFDIWPLNLACRQTGKQ